MTAALSAARDAVLAHLRDDERFVLVTHENPDGDALGSLVAMRELLAALGKDVVILLPETDLPVAAELRFLDLTARVGAQPGAGEGRTAVLLDCGNSDRASGFDLAAAETVLNVDHHHDNTRFGTTDLVDDEASCTAEIVWDLARRLGVEPGQAMAEALYVGLVTDTGRFMYENTGARAHEMAADLIARGVDVHGIYRRVYEDLPFPKLQLLGRALARVRRFDDGRLTIAEVDADDFIETGAEPSYTEGIIDHLRAVTGTKVAALVRAKENGGHPRKVSLRATDGEVDVSAIARAGGGGGHKMAAGFSTDLGGAELDAFLRDQVAAQLG